MIEAHASLAISITVFKKDVERVKRRIFVNGEPVDWTKVNMKGLNNFYRLCFYLLFFLFNKERNDIAAFVPDTEPVDFYFDEQTEKNIVLNEWNNFTEHFLQT